MSTGQDHVPGHRILVHADHPAGCPCPAALTDVVQDVEDRLVGQAGLLQDGPLALGEVSLAGAAVDHADAFAFAAPTPEDEISLAPGEPIGTFGVLATELVDGIHADSP